ncbi:hypothetical protein DDE83_008580 [Stemphylium lycopersici]|uniref:C2H2-type domain-containing protein n=1 Tax=Stemphylium lycopersici TaxID=183478 RepID=A0A364MSY9_STELY|nr:hypothetical protein DDE83_008580 [Stemphylium lycopersici]
MMQPSITVTLHRLTRIGPKIPAFIMSTSSQMTVALQSCRRATFQQKWKAPQNKLRISTMALSPCPIERVPSLVIGGQSQKSSPISPETPNTNASYGFQLQSNKNLVSGVAQSPDDTPLSHNSWAEATGTYMEGYTSQPILASGLGRCFSGPSASIVRGSETDSGVQYKGHWHEVAETRYRDAGMHTTSNGGTPFALESSLATPIALFPNTGSVRLGQREYHELWGWQYGPSCDPRADSSKAANFPTMEASLFKISHQTNQTAERQQSSNYAEFDDEPSPETNLDPGVDEGAEYAGVLCNQCKTVFRGKYSKGNLRRHVSNVHATLASALGLRCRFCKNTYKRRDATRKHEWKKHRSLDAKPKKRTKS